MKGKISGEILNEAISVGYDLQQKSFFDPIDFIAKAWNLKVPVESLASK